MSLQHSARWWRCSYVSGDGTNCANIWTMSSSPVVECLVQGLADVSSQLLHLITYILDIIACTDRSFLLLILQMLYARSAADEINLGRRCRLELLRFSLILAISYMRIPYRVDMKNISPAIRMCKPTYCRCSELHMDVTAAELWVNTCKWYGSIILKIYRIMIHLCRFSFRKTKYSIYLRKFCSFCCKSVAHFVQNFAAFQCREKRKRLLWCGASSHRCDMYSCRSY